MRRALAACVLLVAGIVAPSAEAGSISVSTAVSPRVSRLGDVVQVTVTVRAAQAATVEGGFAPFRVLRSSSTHGHQGVRATSTWRFELQCLEAVCAPGPGTRTVRVAPVQVRAGSASVDVRMPSIVVAPRATARQVASPEGAFLHPTTPVPPTYRFAPGRTRAILFAAAGLLVLIAIAVLVPLARPARRTAPESEADALARALELVRAARARPVPDRRRALGLLARILRRRGRPATAQASADLAWSEPDPDPERITRLADKVEEGSA